MACKTLGRFTYDSSASAAVAAGGLVPLPNSTTEGCIACDGSTITISRAGNYLILANISVAAAAAGSVSAQLYRSGNAVVGAYAQGSAAAVGDFVPLAFSTVVTVPKAAPVTTVNIQLPIAASVRAATVIVSRVNN